MRLQADTGLLVQPGCPGMCGGGAGGGTLVLVNCSEPGVGGWAAVGGGGAGLYREAFD